MTRNKLFSTLSIGMMFLLLMPRTVLAQEPTATPIPLCESELLATYADQGSGMFQYIDPSFRFDPNKFSSILVDGEFIDTEPFHTEIRLYALAPDNIGPTYLNVRQATVYGVCKHVSTIDLVERVSHEKYKAMNYLSFVVGSVCSWNSKCKQLIYLNPFTWTFPVVFLILLSGVTCVYAGRRWERSVARQYIRTPVYRLH